jgi:hypothetical protein
MTRKEAEEQGFEILTYDEAIEIIAEETYRSITENDLIWDIVMEGNGSGVNGMSREDVQDWFTWFDDEVIFDWQLEG